MSENVRETTLKTNNRSSVRLRRERIPSGDKKFTCGKVVYLVAGTVSGSRTIVVEHDVLRLQVSVDDALLV